MMDPSLDAAKDAAKDLASKRERERRRYYARSPKAIRNVVAQVIQRHGYGRQQTDEQLQKAWRDAVGPALAPFSHAGRLQRGKLDVVVANSIVVQELTFDRERILAALQTRLPEARIRTIRFRVGVLPAK